MYMIDNLVNLNHCKESLCNPIFVLTLQPEPFFLSFALYDAKEGKKISEDFYIDPNELEIKKMIPDEVLCASDKLNTVEGKNSAPHLFNLSEEWLLKKDRHVRNHLMFV